MNKKVKIKNYHKIILVSNSSWYLYNFRYPLLKMIKRNGYLIELVAPYDSYTLKLEKAGFKVNYWKLNRKSINPYSELKSLLDLIYIFQKNQPTIIHNFTIKACLYSTIAVNFVKVNKFIKVINSITGLGQVFVSNKKIHLFLRFALRPLYKLVFNNKNSFVIFQNESDQKIFITNKFSKFSNSKVIKGSGVDVNLFKPRKNKNLKINKIPKILFPSRLIYEKGLKELLDASELLWKKNIKFKLLIAGGIEFANSSLIKKKDLYKIKRHKNIRLLGHVDNMYKLYESIDIVVLPSWREGLSRTLIESAAMELPIITSNVSGCNDVVEHGINGILIPSKDEKALSLGIELLLKNPEFAKKLGISARAKVINQFQESIINKQTIEIYREIFS